VSVAKATVDAPISVSAENVAMRDFCMDPLLA
jgi:hypothetical protein